LLSEADEIVARAPSAVLSIVGGLAIAALGPAFIWRFVLHARPGERFDLWFGILVARSSAR
jgi:hypothetical protein